MCKGNAAICKVSQRDATAQIRREWWRSGNERSDQRRKERQRQGVNSPATQGHGKAAERDAMTGNGMASRRGAMAWQIIEGYAQLRHSSECKARAKPIIASLSSGNESRGNEQKSKKERIA